MPRQISSLAIVYYPRDIATLGERVRRTFESKQVLSEEAFTCTRGADCNHEVRRTYVVIERLPLVFRVDVYEELSVKDKFELHAFDDVT